MAWLGVFPLLFQAFRVNYRRIWEQSFCRGRERDRRLTETVQASAQTDSKDAAYTAANSAESKKAVSTLILDVRTVTVMADYFVITGGQSSTQVRAIADAIDDELGKLGLKARSIEGKQEGRWVLMDYGDVIVHILQDSERNKYKLEQFWNHALIVDRKEWLKEDDFNPNQET